MVVVCRYYSAFVSTRVLRTEIILIIWVSSSFRPEPARLVEMYSRKKWRTSPDKYPNLRGVFAQFSSDLLWRTEHANDAPHSV
jgi:hypothetical protein